MVRDRIRLLIVLMAIPFFVVLARLAALQVFGGTEGEEDSRHRRILLLPPTRGSILDRSGALLARDDTIFSLEFNLQDLNPRERYLPVLEKVLGLCDDRCLSGDRRDAAPGDSGGCRGLVLEERLQLILNEAEDWKEAGGEGGRGAEPVLVENIAPALRARLDQKLIRGVRELERRTGIYFLPDPASNMLELRVVPDRVLALERTLRRVAELTGVAYEELRGRVSGAQAEVAAALNATEEEMARRHRRVLADEIGGRAVTEIVYQPELFPGIRVVDGHHRVYPRGESLGAITGYLRSPGDRELAEGRILDSYPLDDIDFIRAQEFGILRRIGCRADDGQVGARGLEEYYDARLRGAYGVRVEEVDARHVARGDPLLYLPPDRGENLRTTLDGELQEIIYRALARACIPAGEALAGSAAVMDLTGAGPEGAGPPGGLLAAAGFPGFDPNKISEPAYQVELDRRQEELHQGILLNRPARVHSPPGSVFKLVVALAAMEGGVEWPSLGGPPRPSPLLPTTRYACTHLLDPANSHSLRCLSQNGHGVPGGEVDLVQALQYSCNIYYYRLGRERLQPGMLWAWGRELGFGRSVGLDVDAPGADPERPAGLLKDRVDRGGMLQYVIGQVHVNASTLQVLRAVAAIALDGAQLPWPWLITPRPPERLKVRRETVRALKEGMYRVVHAAGGTAADERFRLSGYRVALKTGTAEFRLGDPASTDPDRRPLNYAWIAGYAPFDRPEIAFVIQLERAPIHGGDCSAVLVPILEYFAQKEPKKYLVHPQGSASPTGEQRTGN